SRTFSGSSPLTRLVTSFWLSRSCISLGAEPLAAARPFPLGRGLSACPAGNQSGETACKPGSVARLPAPSAIPLGRWSPSGSSHLPASSAEPACGASPHRACLFGVAPDGGCRVSPLQERRAFTPRPCRTRLCGPIRHVAVPGRYPASRSAEPGLSSAKAAAAARPTPIAILPLEVEAGHLTRGSSRR